MAVVFTPLQAITLTKAHGAEAQQSLFRVIYKSTHQMHKMKRLIQRCHVTLQASAIFHQQPGAG